MPTLEFSSEKMYTYVKGFAAALGWNDVLNALSYARKMHGGQTRKDGQPYIVHPLTMACHALALGIKSEKVVAACLLHDVCEDCHVRPEDLPVTAPVQNTVRRLTHIKGTPLDAYYAGIQEDCDACLTKILDRCHNVSSMAGTFTRTKCRDYIQEADAHVMPLFRVVKEARPELSSILFVLKYHITAMDNSLAALLDGTSDGASSREGGGACPT